MLKGCILYGLIQILEGSSLGSGSFGAVGFSVAVKPAVSSRVTLKH